MGGPLLVLVRKPHLIPPDEGRIEASESKRLESNSTRTSAAITCWSALRSTRWNAPRERVPKYQDANALNQTQRKSMRVFDVAVFFAGAHAVNPPTAHEAIEVGARP